MNKIAELIGIMTKVETNCRMVTDKDEELLALLKADSRRSTASLARALGVSRTTVQDRIRRLEENGVIDGYTVRLGERHSANGLSAFVSISVEPKRTADVVAQLRRLPTLDELHSVSGKFDLIAAVSAVSTERLDRLLDQIGTIDGVLRTESSVVLSTRLRR